MFRRLPSAPSNLSSVAIATLLLGGIAVAAACSKKANDEPVINDPALAQLPTTPKPAVQNNAAAANSGAAPSKGTGSIEGTVKFTGTPPEMKLIDKVSDPVCQVEPPKDNSVLVGSNQGLKDVLVRIEPGAVDGDLPSSCSAAKCDDGKECTDDSKNKGVCKSSQCCVPTMVQLTQHHCMYVPRLLGVMTGQAIEYINSDKTMHNVHTYLGSETRFNAGQPAGDKVKSSIEDDGIIKVKCDVHPWMTAYIVATDHPYFAVTDETGHFRIEKVPAGKYRLEAWHSQLGLKEVKDFEVGPGKGGDPGFSYTGTETAN